MKTFQLAAFSFFLFALPLEALDRSGFECSTGPGFRQDWIDWRVDGEDDQIADHERYPHLRMFDWTIACDASLQGLHLQVRGDWGWFSSQSMEKRENLAINGRGNPTSPAKFAFISQGRAAAADLRLGYQIDLLRTEQLMPIAGWIMDRIEILRTRPIPPFYQTAEGVAAPYVQADHSVRFLSRLHQRWAGPTIGLEWFGQILRWLSLDASYCFGWLTLREQSSEEDNTLLYLAGPTPSGTIRSTAETRTHAPAHGHIATCKIGMDLSRNWIAIFDARSFYFYTNHCHSSQLWNGNKTRASSKAMSLSISAIAELAYRF
jgi:hypothetical protein